jgi:hypothetical protein
MTVNTSKIVCIAIHRVAEPHKYKICLVLEIRMISIAFGCFDVDKIRAASNDMTNSYLAGGLVGPAGVAKLLSFRTSNPPPSKEGGEGDCDYSA